MTMGIRVLFIVVRWPVVSGQQVFTDHWPLATDHSSLLGLGRIRRRFGCLGVAVEADDLVADAVLDGFLRGEEPVALGILADLFLRLAGALGHDADEIFLGL